MSTATAALNANIQYQREKQGSNWTVTVVNF